PDAVDVTANGVLQEHSAVRQARLGIDLRLGDALEISAARTSQDRQLAPGQLRAEVLRLRAKKHLRERILVQVADVAGAIVVLAIARDCEVAIDGDIVLRLARERRAMKALPAQTRRPFQIMLEALANNVAD